MIVAAALAAFVLSGVAPAAAQDAGTRTAWGQPDLRGIWDFRTVTPVERPPEALANREFLTEEEVVNLEQDLIDRNSHLPSTGYCAASFSMARAPVSVPSMP